MSNDDRSAERAAHIDALMAAARIERARTLQRLLRRLLRRRGEVEVWRAPVEPALSDCR
jgi:hypothetical protein